MGGKKNLDNNNNNIFRLGELFCGPGGLAYGAMNAKIKNPDFKIIHQWATDYDSDTCQTYINNICPDNPNSVICDDIRKLDLKKLTNIGDIDALAFGFPCNDFSVVGEQKGVNGTFRPLYSYGIKVLKKCKPQWFLAENVGGLKSANNGKAIDVIFNAMIDAGYRIYPNYISLKIWEQFHGNRNKQSVLLVAFRKHNTIRKFR